MRIFLCGVSSLILCLSLLAGEKQVSAKSSSIHAASTEEVAQLYKNFDYKAHTVTLERFLELAADPKTIILDLRNEDSFERGHVKGARHLGADVTKEKLVSLIPHPETTILVYCRDSLEFTPSRMLPLTYTLVPQIYALGYRNVYLLPRGDCLEKLPWEGSRKLTPYWRLEHPHR